MKKGEDEMQFLERKQRWGGAIGNDDFWLLFCVRWQATGALSREMA